LSCTDAFPWLTHQKLY